jgi:hypothetical protein
MFGTVIDRSHFVSKLNTMKKIRTYIFNKYVDYKLAQLTKVRFVAMNDYCGNFYEPGEKTFGRFQMFEAIQFVMYKVYGEKWELTLRINGIQITEDANKVYVKLMTHKPGQVIGKMGSKISELANTLSSVFLKDTEIKLEETEELYGLKYEENY